MFKFLATAACFLGLSIGAQAATYTMGFDALGTNGGTNASADGTTYSEDGMTMTHLFGHFDRYRFHSSLSPDPTDHNPVIHEGNGGSGVSFSLGGAAFDLLSIDVLGWWFGNNPDLTTNVTFNSSSGGSFVLNASAAGPNFTGLLDFSTKAGFSNITGFNIVMPNPRVACTSVGPYNCPNFGFDNVSFKAPPAPAIPLPAGGLLLLSALGLTTVLRRHNR